MLTTACCLVVGLGIRGIRIGFSVWLVSGYAHLFILLFLVIVPHPVQISTGTLPQILGGRGGVTAFPDSLPTYV